MIAQVVPSESKYMDLMASIAQLSGVAPASLMEAHEVGAGMGSVGVVSSSADPRLSGGSLPQEASQLARHLEQEGLTGSVVAPTTSWNGRSAGNPAGSWRQDE